jgi:hypothetical protein
MADIKPLGSEKLQGDDKLKRILELTYYGNKKNSSNTATAEYVTESVNGVYGIVKEKDGYYVKKGLNESSLDYIGGLFMKNKNKFSSYAEALKRLELLNGQEQLQEATKYVLKQNKPADVAEPVEAPMPEPVSDVPAEVPSDVPAPIEEPSMDLPSEEPEMGDEGQSETKPSDYMAEIQKFSGKLGQELRDQKEKLESDDIKYVLNMIISAVDLDKLSDEDIEDIAAKFERDEESNELPSDEESMEPEMGEPEVGGEEEEDLGEMDMMDKLESFINTPTPMAQDEEIDLSKFADLGKGMNEDELKEIDLDEIKKEINKSIEETLGKYFK